MAKLDVEAVDLGKLVDVVRGTTEEAPLVGAIVGRSLLRDIVAEYLECSMLEAEELVDTMVARGFARLERDDEGREVWRLGRDA
jgi:hypothetical protein